MGGGPIAGQLDQVMARFGVQEAAADHRCTRIASSAVGKQILRISAEFGVYTIASYVSNFDAFTGQRFDVSPDTRALPNNEQVVTTRIIPASGDAHRLDYVMRQNDGAWQVVDVLADGTISRVAVQRSDFRRLLMRGGSAALVASLRSKAAQLAEG